MTLLRQLWVELGIGRYRGFQDISAWDSAGSNSATTTTSNVAAEAAASTETGAAPVPSDAALARVFRLRDYNAYTKVRVHACVCVVCVCL